MTVQPIPVEQIRSEVAPVAIEAAELEVRNQKEMTHAADFLVSIKRMLGKVAELCDPVIKAAHAAHKAAVAQKNTLQAPLLEAEKELKGKISTFVAEESRKAREQAALEEAAAREAREKAEREAKELREMGESELADAVEETAEVEAAPPAPAEAPKAAGVSVRHRYTAEVTDLKALVAAVASGRVPLAAVQANQKVINQQARSLGNELHWPGVRVRKVTDVAASGRDGAYR